MQQEFDFSGLGYIDYQETHMNKNEKNKNQLKGRVEEIEAKVKKAEGRTEEAEGKVKEAVGVLLDDKDMQIKGNVQKNVGKVKSGYFDGLNKDTKK
jgi:uncharacterized protein YjbJ (UPF0337 family)